MQLSADCGWGKGRLEKAFPRISVQLLTYCCLLLRSCCWHAQNLSNKNASGHKDQRAGSGMLPSWFRAMHVRCFLAIHTRSIMSHQLGNTCSVSNLVLKHLASFLFPLDFLCSVWEWMNLALLITVLAISAVLIVPFHPSMSILTSSP